MFPTFKAGQVHLWAHDICLLPYGCNLTNEQILAKWSGSISKCVALTGWHKNEFVKLYPNLADKIITIPMANHTFFLICFSPLF